MAAITSLDRIDVTFNAREVARIEQTAQQLFDRSRLTERQVAAFGLRPGSLEAADLDTIRQHVSFCAIIQRAYQMTIDPVAMWGKGRDEIAEIGAAKAARRITGHSVNH